MFSVIAGSAFGLAEANPVGCFVASSLEAVALDEGLQQKDGMPVLAHPVAAYSFCDSRQNVTCQVRDRDPGQDEKPAVVGYQMHVCFALLCVPADERIPRPRFPCCRAEHEAGQGVLMFVEHEVVHVLSHWP